MNPAASAPQATVFFCHGSRDPQWRAPFDLLAAAYQARVPQQQVRLAFLELMTPELPAVLAELAAAGVGRARIVPIFLAPGAHTRRDLPALVAQARRDCPHLQVEILPTLLESEVLRASVVDALQSALEAGPLEAVITQAHNVTPIK
ncbi:MAG: CbiX/SirB N-terminal domain-containing protein [Lautropia sp.]|nr:CbiX/SirB N-terminal domain-containing protein [Lautropia sp.]